MFQVDTLQSWLKTMLFDIGLLRFRLDKSQQEDVNGYALACDHSPLLLGQWRLSRRGSSVWGEWAFVLHPA